MPKTKAAHGNIAKAYRKTASKRKVHLIQPDGVVMADEVSPGPSVYELQKLVHGYFEEVTVLYLGRRRTAFINEEARSKEMSFNLHATKYVQAAHDVPTVPIFGPMIVLM